MNRHRLLPQLVTRRAAPGEMYNRAMVCYLEEVVAAGGFVEGAVDQALSQLRVVATGP